MKLHHQFPSLIHSLPPLIISSDLKEEKCSEKRKTSHAIQVSQDVYHWCIRNAEVTQDKMSSTFTYQDFLVTLSPISRGFNGGSLSAFLISEQGVQMKFYRVLSLIHTQIVPCVSLFPSQASLLSESIFL